MNVINLANTIEEMEKAVELSCSEPGRALEDLAWLLSTPTFDMIPAGAYRKMIDEDFEEELIDTLENILEKCDDYDYPIVEEMINILLHNTP